MERKKMESEMIVESGDSKYEQKITIGKHTFIADEPLAVGGDDKGPSPYDFILAALGSCTNMTIKVYAELKKIPLVKVIVRLRHHKNHVDDCVNCEKKNTRLVVIEREIELIGPLSVEQKEMLLNIANRCPIHQTLTSANIIETKLV